MYLWVIAAVTAYFIKGLCGFANTLVFDTIMGFTADPALITPVEVVINTPSNCIMVWRERQYIQWKKCLPVTALIILGSIPGMLMLKSFNAQWLKAVFGVIVALLGVEMLLRDLHHQKMKSNPVVLTLIGLLSGVMCGLFGIGALTAAYMSRVTDDTASFRANICVAFLANAVFRCAAYAWLGIITWETVKISLLMLPVMVVFVLLGMRCARLLPEKLVKRCVTVALIISGLALVIKNVI